MGGTSFWALRCKSQKVSSLWPLCMHPAQGMARDLELASIVAEDDGVGQQAMCLDGAPQCALGGQPRWIEPVR